MRRKINCTFPQEIIREPLLYNLARNFNVVPNIRGASVTIESGFMALELEGDDGDVARAVDYLKDRGVQIELVTGEDAAKE